MHKPFGAFKHIVGNGHGRLHTESMTNIPGFATLFGQAPMCPRPFDYFDFFFFAFASAAGAGAGAPVAVRFTRFPEASYV
jgi:hypothetical protein